MHPRQDFPANERLCAAGHDVVSVPCRDERPAQRARALADLEAALPSPASIEAAGGRVTGVVTTPDFHPGRPVPIGVVVATEGVVLPHLIGNDIGCGMRMSLLRGVSVDDLADPAIDHALRHAFFQGGRDIALTGADRFALLADGLPGLLASLRSGRGGALARLDLAGAVSNLERTCDLGAHAAAGVILDFLNYADREGGLRRDAILGSIGGGNHFVEIGWIDRIVDGHAARACRARCGDVVLTVHSGSLDFGQRVGSRARADASEMNRPDSRVHALRTPAAQRFLCGMANAANAAFGNRFLLEVAAAAAIGNATGREVVTDLIYDAPHNLAWMSGERVLHRKGACPARGFEAMVGSPYAFVGEPVVLPGSMGDGTWLLAGTGRHDTLASAAHGAGRLLSRKQARRVPTDFAALRVVGPVDLSDRTLLRRPDILRGAEARLREEAPAAYRPIADVVKPMVDTGMVTPILSTRPVITVKG
jgi:tRNA-splicing ligase RtcB